jgi:HTH-type transcriptional regulator / antitoxin HigA
MTLGIPNTSAYIELLKYFPPRPITCDEEFTATQKVIDSLIDKDELTLDERDYINVLGALVFEYEEKYTNIPDIYGVELLKTLIFELSLDQKDLISIFTDESILSEVLNGQCDLTINHIQQLADFFHISPSAFLKSS